MKKTGAGGGLLALLREKDLLGKKDTDKAGGPDSSQQTAAEPRLSLEKNSGTSTSPRKDKELNLQLVRNPSKKKTLAEKLSSFVNKKSEKDKDDVTELKRASSIKEKLLEEESEEAEVPEDFSENKVQQFKQRLHLLINCPLYSRIVTSLPSLQW